MQDLTDQVAIVTGGARGIGRAIAEVLVAEGASVAIADVDLGAADATASELSDGQRRTVAVEVDVTDRSSAAAMATAVIDRFDRIDILAANAGIYPESLIEDVTDKQWDLVMDVNVKGTLHTLQACLPQMRKQGYGRIVLTSSITGPITGISGLGHYGASKAAMLGLMRSAAIEVARDGITINAVLPGNIMTPGLAQMGDDHIRRMKATVPQGELGEPSDIGWAVRFLGSREAKFVTGHALIVDGGQILPEGSLDVD